MSKDKTVQAQAKSAAKAASRTAGSLKARVEKTAVAARTATAGGIHAVHDAVSNSKGFYDAAEEIKRAAEPVREAAKTTAEQIAEQARNSAGTLTARTAHRSHGRKSGRSGRGRLVLGVCTAGAIGLLWWLGRNRSTEHATTDLPARPVPRN